MDPAVQAFLADNGAAIHLIGLEGFLYEGVAARLLRYVESVAERQPWLRFVVLDLHAVQGVEPCVYMVTAAIAYGHGLHTIWPRPPLHIVTASITYGYSLYCTPCKASSRRRARCWARCALAWHGGRCEP